MSPVLVQPCSLNAVGGKTNLTKPQNSDLVLSDLKKYIYIFGFGSRLSKLMQFVPVSGSPFRPSPCSRQKDVPGVCLPTGPQELKGLYVQTEAACSADTEGLPCGSPHWSPAPQGQGMAAHQASSPGKAVVALQLSPRGRAKRQGRLAGGGHCVNLPPVPHKYSSRVLHQAARPSRGPEELSTCSFGPPGGKEE